MKSSARKSKKRFSPWKEISTSDLQAQIDSCLFARSVPGLGTVLIPKKHVSVQSSLLSVLDNDQLREAAEEVLESESLEDVFSPFLSENPKWIVYCSVTDSMVSGSWGLKAFVLGERGYIYNELDWGTGDDAVVLPILAAWEPVGDSLAFRASFLYTYNKYWNDIGLPPCMGQWAVGPFDRMVEAVSSVLRRNRKRWSLPSACICERPNETGSKNR